MDEPARKRRKTNSPEERERQSSPLRKPPRRPSFASPTKSSLARNYPNLLRPTSAGAGSRPSSRGDIRARGRQARAFVLGETETNDSQSQESGENTNSTMPSARQYPKNNTPPARKVFRHQDVPVSIGAIHDEEPELPATPSQRGLEEQDGPRRGILFSSPSKRPPRMKDTVKRSPLRPKAPPVHKETLVDAVEIGSGDTQDQRLPESNQRPDPEVEKRRQETARLQREIKELDSQLLRCAEEISKEQQRAPGQALEPTERGDLKYVWSFSLFGQTTANSILAILSIRSAIQTLKTSS